MSSRSQSACDARRRRALSVTASGLLLLAGCASGGNPLSLTGQSPGGETGAALQQSAGASAKPTEGWNASVAAADSPPHGQPALSPAAAKVLAQARRLRATGNSKDAMELIETAARAEPDNRSLTVEQGLMALEAGHMAKARDLLTLAGPRTSNDWQVASGLGVAQSSLGNHPEARKSFARALELSPNNPAVLNNLGLSYILDGKLDEAADVLRRASMRSGQKSPAARNLAIAIALKEGPSRPAGGATATADPVPPPQQPKRSASEVFGSPSGLGAR